MPKFTIYSFNDDNFSDCKYSYTMIYIYFKITKFHMSKYFVVTKYKLSGKYVLEQIWVICFFLCQTTKFQELIQIIKNLCNLIIATDDYIKSLTKTFFISTLTVV